MATKTAKTVAKSGLKNAIKPNRISRLDSADKPKKKKTTSKKGKRGKGSDVEVLLSSNEKVSKYGLKHKTNRYNKKGQPHTRPISINHVVGTYLNNVGINGKTSVQKVHDYVEKQLGRVPTHVTNWLEQQAGLSQIGGITIKRPKIDLNRKTGAIQVLQLFQFRG